MFSLLFVTGKPPHLFILIAKLQKANWHSSKNFSWKQERISYVSYFSGIIHLPILSQGYWPQDLGKISLTPDIFKFVWRASGILNLQQRSPFLEWNVWMSSYGSTYMLYFHMFFFCCKSLMLVTASLIYYAHSELPLAVMVGGCIIAYYKRMI